MTILSLTKRVDRLGPGTGGYLSFAEGLELVRERDKDRYRAWTAAGNRSRKPKRDGFATIGAKSWKEPD